MDTCDDGQIMDLELSLEAAEARARAAEERVTELKAYNQKLGISLEIARGEIRAGQTAQLDMAQRLNAEYRRVAVAREALAHIAYNISLSMPAAWNDERSWYERQFKTCIGHAARALARLYADKETE